MKYYYICYLIFVVKLCCAVRYYNNNNHHATSSCRPKYNIVFLKTHKCASSTIQNILMRKGMLNNKVFVLPAKHNYLGHPKPFTRDLVPNKTKFKNDYNILTHHSRLGYEAMRGLMPNNTLFITIIRDPVELFESMFQYYELDQFWNIPFDLFGNPSVKIPDRVFRTRYNERIGINQMMFDLGMNKTVFKNRPNFRESQNIVKNYIKKLDSIFDLVMWTKQMDESLILLKHLLCWSDNDIIAFKLNARPASAKRNISKTARLRIGALNWADVELYNHFAKKFLETVRDFGINKMNREVNKLRLANSLWQKVCAAIIKASTNTQRLSAIQVGTRHYVNTTCHLMTADEMDFTNLLRKIQLKHFPGSIFKK